MSNGLNSDQDRHSVGPDQDPTVCKGYQQTTKVAAGKERVNQCNCRTSSQMRGQIS